MKLLAKFLLWLIGTAIPVFIAACYGAPYYWNTKSGQVIDSDSKEGIGGIQVTCIDSYGNAGDVSYSYEDGAFTVSYGQPCDHLLLEDVDGPDNGGQYVRRSVPFDEECEDLTIELHE